MRSAAVYGKFQSTRLREARQSSTYLVHVTKRFQSTRLREARQPRVIRDALRQCFNPRACVRRDLPRLETWKDIAKFQSTRLREARQNWDHFSLPIPEFQSTRLREARPELISSTTSLLSFNPRACVRRDPVLEFGLGRGNVSIHAPA